MLQRDTIPIYSTYRTCCTCMLCTTNIYCYIIFCFTVSFQIFCILRRWVLWLPTSCHFAKPSPGLSPSHLMKKKKKKVVGTWCKKKIADYVRLSIPVQRDLSPEQVSTGRISKKGTLNERRPERRPDMVIGPLWPSDGTRLSHLLEHLNRVLIFENFSFVEANRGEGIRLSIRLDELRLHFLQARLPM